MPWVVFKFKLMALIFFINLWYIVYRKDGPEEAHQGSFDPKDVETVKLGATKRNKRKESYDYSDTVQVIHSLSVLYGKIGVRFSFFMF